MFDFRNLPSTDKLYFELLNSENSPQIYALFRGDSNEFVEERFLDRELAKTYAKQVISNMQKSHRAGCDWLIKNEVGAYMGILHLYGMNSNPEFDTCSIGFAIAAPFRRQGVAARAIHQLVTYVFDYFHINVIYAHTHHLNHATQGLLSRLGFVYHGQGIQKGQTSVFFHYNRTQHHVNTSQHQIRQRLPKLDPNINGFGTEKGVRFLPFSAKNRMWLNEYCPIQTAKELMPLSYKPEPPYSDKLLDKLCQVIDYQRNHQLVLWWWMQQEGDTKPIGLMRLSGVGWWYGDDVDFHRDKRIVQKAQITLRFFTPMSIAMFEQLLRLLKSYCRQQYGIEEVIFNFDRVELR